MCEKATGSLERWKYCSIVDVMFIDEIARNQSDRWRISSNIAFSVLQKYVSTLSERIPPALKSVLGFLL